jgi:hypothetical protein
MATRIVPRAISETRAYNTITRADFTPESIEAAITRLYDEAFDAGREDALMTTYDQ